MPNQKKPLNLKEVSRILGVSTATVSNAFNRPNQLSERLRERILKECETLGYHGPNLAARSLRRGKSDVVAVVLADSLSYSFSDPVASQFLQGVAEVLAQHNKQLLLLSSQVGGKEQNSAESLPDGFIFCGAPSGDCEKRIMRLGKPAVAVDFQAESNMKVVQIEDQKAAKNITLHALKSHRGNLAVLGLKLIESNRVCRLTQADLISEQNDVAHRRLRGYLEAAEETKTELQPHMVWHVPVNDPENAEIAAREILTTRPLPSTVLCMSDVLALAVLRVAKSLNIGVPEQVQIVGFDGISESERCEPQLTTVCQQSIEKGRIAASVLLDPEAENETTVKTDLVIRGTTRSA
ncbi:LacI family DNA-binding transcriptional regulator [Alteromonas sp. a30]|uniref:LacI family DNA-binding transcriptional regulator n=1 Tax=Alteromonas sp. a30 TaxID=2730917 RepID=UPI00227E2AE3|nr:LacI family DNA-binding transcriptional regulator [Alteromonas sp. a30]MCY7297164.1 LacI family DNA-binding transcriptional regulator [Alteromonas sp. a30]